MYTETAYPVIDLVETGRRIERQRRQAGLTVRDLQAYFGFEYPQAIYKWQHGECLPTVDNLLALARLLRVPMEDLLVYEDQGGSHFLECFCAIKKSETGFHLFRTIAVNTSHDSAVLTVTCERFAFFALKAALPA